MTTTPTAPKCPIDALKHCGCCLKPKYASELAACCKCGVVVGLCCASLASIYTPELCPTCRNRGAK